MARCGRRTPPPPAVAEVVEESAGVKLVEECAVAVRGQMAAGVEMVHRRPPDGFVQGVPGADFEEERQIAVFAGQVAA